jgi:hypothetical protein
LLVYLSDLLRKFSFRNFGFIERGQFLSTKRSIFIYPYRLMVEGDYFFIDKNKISNEEVFRSTLTSISQKLNNRYELTKEENHYKVTRVK